MTVDRAKINTRENGILSDDEDDEEDEEEDQVYETTDTSYTPSPPPPESSPESYTPSPLPTLTQSLQVALTFKYILCITLFITSYIFVTFALYFRHVCFRIMKIGTILL